MGCPAQGRRGRSFSGKGIKTFASFAPARDSAGLEWPKPAISRKSLISGRKAVVSFAVLALSVRKMASGCVREWFAEWKGVSGRGWELFSVRKDAVGRGGMGVSERQAPAGRAGMVLALPTGAPGRRREGAAGRKGADGEVRRGLKRTEARGGSSGLVAAFVCSINLCIR